MTRSSIEAQCALYREDDIVVVESLEEDGSSTSCSSSTNFGTDDLSGSIDRDEDE